MFYAYSVLCCLPSGMEDHTAAGTGTVMRRSTFEDYARRAGFDEVQVLPIEHDFLRFYRLDNAGLTARSILVGFPKLLRPSAAALVVEPPFDRGAGRPRGAASGRRWREGVAEYRGETIRGGLPVAELGPMFRRGHRDDSVDETSAEMRQRPRPLRVVQGGRGAQVHAQLHPCVGGVDVLAPGAGGTAQPPP